MECSRLYPHPNSVQMIYHPLSKQSILTFQVMVCFLISAKLSLGNKESSLSIQERKSNLVMKLSPPFWTASRLIHAVATIFCLKLTIQFTIKTMEIRKIKISKLITSLSMWFMEATLRTPVMNKLVFRERLLGPLNSLFTQERIQEGLATSKETKY